MSATELMIMRSSTTDDEISTIYIENNHHLITFDGQYSESMKTSPSDMSLADTSDDGLIESEEEQDIHNNTYLAAAMDILPQSTYFLPNSNTTNNSNSHNNSSCNSFLTKIINE